MSKFKIGDIVARQSYGKDIFFKIVDLKERVEGTIAILKGISYRIIADSPEEDLVIESEQNVREYQRSSFLKTDRKTRAIKDAMYRKNIKKAYYKKTTRDNSRKFKRPGKVLHLDGDEEYLDTCIKEYEKLYVNVDGKYVPEKEQPYYVYELLKKYTPDILVLTGHDGLIKGKNNYKDINNYRNSRYFIQAVREARKFNSDLDGLVIFAGACQSMYNEIIKAGANYASSPSRVLIHALDPVYVSQKIAYSHTEKLISPMDIINATITGYKGIGGLDTRGRYREGYPIEPH
jgi:spore coat assemly protein